MLAKNHLQLALILVRYDRPDRGVECLEQFSRKRANIIKVKLEGMLGLLSSNSKQSLASEFGRKCHGDMFSLGFVEEYERPRTNVILWKKRGELIQCTPRMSKWVGNKRKVNDISWE